MSMRALRKIPRPVLAVAAVTVAAALVAGVAVSFDGNDRPDAVAGSSDPAGFTVLAPDDGQLVVAETAVRQLAGSCETEQTCYYARVDPAELPVVTVSAGTRLVPVTAQVSGTFTVGAFNTADPAKAVSIGFANGSLLLDDVDPGTYQVSLSGDAGGVWQFQLVVNS